MECLNLTPTPPPQLTQVGPSSLGLPFSFQVSLDF